MSSQGLAPRIAEPARSFPPGPKGLPVLGNLLDMGRDTLGFLEACAHEHGDVVAFRLGSWPCVLLSNPDDIETVLVKRHGDFVKNSFFWRHVTGLFGQGILTSEGELWRRQRRIAAPAFAGPRLKAYGVTIVEHTIRQIALWRDGQTFDLHEEMMKLSLRIAAKTLFNSEVERDIETIDHALNDLLEEIRARFVRPVFIPDWVPLPGHLRYGRGIRNIEKVLDRMICERRSNVGDRQDFLSELMAARDKSGRPMSDRQLRDEAITLLLAGHETTALTLSWTWHFVGQDSDVGIRLAEEVDQVLGGHPPTVDDIPKLSFTEAVIQESMRLRPPAWGIGREALKDTEIGGYPIRVGTTIFISQWVLHHHPRYFDDPRVFRPDRWMSGLANRLPRFAFFPFGGGPRICIGHRFAMMEAVLMLATMVQHVTLEWQRDRPVEPFPSITLRPKGGVWVKVKKRRTR